MPGGPDFVLFVQFPQQGSIEEDLEQFRIFQHELEKR